MCNCLLSTRIESELFAGIDNNIPDEDCPICLVNLKQYAPSACCGGYARKLNCGHYVHVSCQIDKNHDLIHCSLCRTKLTTSNIYFKICRAKMINGMPHGYSKLYINDQLTDKMKDDLKTKYHFDIDRLTRSLDYLNTIKDDEKEMFDFFKMVWTS